MALDTCLLSLMTFIPSVGGLVILLLKVIEPLLKRSGKTLPPIVHRWVALTATAIPLLLSIRLWSRSWWPGVAAFDPSGGTQFVHHFVWMKDFNIEYFMGADGISVTMIILTALISFIACLASATIVKKPAAA